MFWSYYNDHNSFKENNAKEGLALALSPRLKPVSPELGVRRSTTWATATDFLDERWVVGFLPFWFFEKYFRHQEAFRFGNGAILSRVNFHRHRVDPEPAPTTRKKWSGRAPRN